MCPGAHARLKHSDACRDCHLKLVFLHDMHAADIDAGEKTKTKCESNSKIFAGKKKLNVVEHLIETLRSSAG